MDEAVTHAPEAREGGLDERRAEPPERERSEDTRAGEKRAPAGKRWSGTGGAGLVAGLALLPTAVGVAISFFYFAEWPSDSGIGPVLFGTIFGGALWILASLTALRTFGDVSSADGGVYEELLTRLTSLQGRMTPHSGGGSDPYREAREHVRRLETELHPARASATHGSALRWLGGYGYVNLWRHVHRAEESLLRLEPKPGSLYVAAIADEGRLQQASVDSRDVLLRALRDLLGDREKRQEQMSAILTKLDSDQGRALLGEIRYVLNSYRDELWQRLVSLRNRMFETFVFTGLVFDGLLALSVGVLDRSYEGAIAVALSYYLIGAIVGLFAELYGASRRQRGVVHDYGLAVVRLMTIPVLSGIAAIGGVVLTRLGGTTGTQDAAPFTEIFSLQSYPFGVVIAAIFGLTPGLLLGRLRDQTEEYEKALVQSGPTTQRTDGENNG